MYVCVCIHECIYTDRQSNNNDDFLKDQNSGRANVAMNIDISISISHQTCRSVGAIMTDMTHTLSTDTEHKHTILTVTGNNVPTPRIKTESVE